MIKLPQYNPKNDVEIVKAIRTNGFNGGEGGIRTLFAMFGSIPLDSLRPLQASNTKGFADFIKFQFCLTLSQVGYTLPQQRPKELTTGE